MPRPLRVAVQGCCHGELNAVYAALAAEEARDGRRIDLLIVGGDFQSVRNLSDLQCMAVPAKFRRLGDFADYYAGRRRAPVLTLFVGGNHEASNYLQELPYGGWVAPDIYYLGLSNVVAVAGLRIGGVSGIWSHRDHVRGHTERVPYDAGSLRSVYHVRQYQVRKLLAYAAAPAERLDVCLSHDWPRGIDRHGDAATLVRRKPFFRDEIARNALGSPANEELLRTLRPRYWFSAHLHVRFEALVDHAASGEKRARGEVGSPRGRGEHVRGKVVVDKDQPIEPLRDPDEIALDLDGLDEEEVARNPDEIVLTLSDEESPTTAPSTDAQDRNVKVQDPNEIDLSLDEDDTLQGDEAPPLRESKERPEAELTLEEYKRQVLARNGLDESQKDDSGAKRPDAAHIHQNQTHFLALDKCLPRRQFLEVMTIERPGLEETEEEETVVDLQYDPDWLAIVRTYAPYHSTSAYQKKLPTDLSAELSKNRAWVAENVTDLKVPLNFVQTAPIQDHTITERTRRK